MKRVILVVLSVIALVLVPILVIGSAQHNAAKADPIVKCSVHKNTVTCTAAGVVVLQEQLPLPTVTIKVPLPQRTIKVPGPTVRVPGPTHTSVVERTKIETVPGPITIKTMRVPSTKTVSPAPQSTITVTASPEITQDRSRQPRPTPATLVPPARHSVINVPAISLSAPAAVGIGLLTLAILAGLIILGLWAGYYLGYKDSDRAERKFLRALLRK